MPEHFTPDCLCENVGVSKTRGPQEAIAFFEQFCLKLPFVSIDVDLLAIAASGEAVLSERGDHTSRAPTAPG